MTSSFIVQLHSLFNFILCSLQKHSLKLPTELQLFFQTFNGFSIEWDVQIKGLPMFQVCLGRGCRVTGWLHIGLAHTAASAAEGCYCMRSVLCVCVRFDKVRSGWLTVCTARRQHACICVCQSVHSGMCLCLQNF